MRTFRQLAMTLAGLAGLLASDASALTVSPLQLEMSSAGTRSRSQITVVNDGETPLPVEAIVQRLSVDENGRQSTAKAGEEFLVMPPQAIIPPGATQNFRVQWLGEPLLAKSESFVLAISQVPVKLEKSKPRVQVVMALGVMINVAPPDGAPMLSVVGTGISADKSGKRLAAITVENPGKVHALLPQAAIELSSAGWSTTIRPQSIEERIGIGLVQPGKRRKFVLPVEIPASVSKFEAKIEFPNTRP